MTYETVCCIIICIKESNIQRHKAPTSGSILPQHLERLNMPTPGDITHQQSAFSIAPPGAFRIGGGSFLLHPHSDRNNGLSITDSPIREQSTPLSIHSLYIRCWWAVSPETLGRSAYHHLVEPGSMVGGIILPSAACYVEASFLNPHH